MSLNKTFSDHRTASDFARPHTPPLGHRALTPFYDYAIAALTREKKWRTAFIEAINPSPGDRILDIGAGTGSLAVALNETCAEVHYVGIDPDEDAIQRAREKTKSLSCDIRFQEGYFSADETYFDRPPNKIVSSLVLHQVPLSEKRRIILDARKALTLGGFLFIADYARQQGLQRLFFRATVQMLDGVEDTQPNADGIIDSLISDAAFGDFNADAIIQTPSGTITIFVATN